MSVVERVVDWFRVVRFIGLIAFEKLRVGVRIVDVLGFVKFDIFV